jgi:hypothetical protein
LKTTISIKEKWKMAQYKTVAAPTGLVISKNESYEEAAKSYAALIDQEAVGGWELLLIQEIPITKKKGCVAALLALIGMGSAEEYVNINMMVFVKKD